MEHVVTRYGIEIDLSREGKTACPRCREKYARDRSGDNLHVYGLDADGRHQGAKCFSCDWTIPSVAWLEEHGEVTEEDEDDYEITGYDSEGNMVEFTEEEHNKLKKITTFKGKGFRGIRDETYKYFGVRHEYDTTTGKLLKQYYPETHKYELTGYKIRILPKNFDKVGITGAGSDLCGQFRFKDSHGKYCLITAGEIDQLSGYQMLRDYQLSRGQGDYDPIPVVSPTTGESGTRQLKDQFEWLDRFERIVVCYDPDDAGRKAVEKAVKVLPRGKVYVMSLQEGVDTNDYLTSGREKEWINAFYKARKYVPQGVTSSLELEEKMLEYMSQQRITLPSFMHRMQKMLCGGIPLPCIVNLLSASGTGKSTTVNEMIIHWVMNTPYTVGIVSLEAGEGEYGVNLSSSYCGFKANLLESEAERIAWLNKPENKAKRMELWQKENGEPRFYLLDSDMEHLKSKVEYLVVSLGCKIIVLDPLQDIFDALGEDEQAKFMKWQKDFMKRENMVFINVNHARKNSKGQKANSTGADLSEEDMMGHSSIFKSGGINIIFMRDKEAEDLVERNTTRVKITKARGVGNTGPAGEYYYVNEEHKMYDKSDYFSARGGEF